MIEEHWEPKTDDLEPIKVTREIPQIDIMLKKAPTDTCDKELIPCTENLDIFLETYQSKSATKRQKLKHFVLDILQENFLVFAYYSILPDKVILVQCI